MLQDWSNGDREALDQLLPVVYDELRQQAARYLRSEDPGHTLQTDALINEAYIKLVDQRKVDWKNRAHFFAIVATLMRRILVEHARNKRCKKRGGGDRPLVLNEELFVLDNEQSLDLLALNEALRRLAQINKRKVQVAELRYFGGLTLEETAEVLRVSRSTVANDWNMARAWLHRELAK